MRLEISSDSQNFLMGSQPFCSATADKTSNLSYLTNLKCSNIQYLTHQHFRRATEIAQRDRTDGLVGTSHVIEAHNEMFCSPKVD